MNAKRVTAPRAPKKLHLHATEKEPLHAERANAKPDGRVCQNTPIGFHYSSVQRKTYELNI